MFLTEVGFKSNKNILKSLLISKFLNFNNLTIPKSDQLKLIFPLIKIKIIFLKKSFYFLKKIFKKKIKKKKILKKKKKKKFKRL